jgi:hypothetical protein
MAAVVSVKLAEKETREKEGKVRGERERETQLGVLIPSLRRRGGGTNRCAGRRW